MQDEATFDAVDARATRVVQFWELSRKHAGFGKLSAVVGTTFIETVPPEAWAFGDSPELADELLDLVLAGTKTGTASGLIEYEVEGASLPRQGDLSIILDGAGEPRALIRTTSVAVVPFDEVDAEFARLEGEGDLSLDYWRQEHERYWRRALPQIGHEFSPTMNVICETFELLYPKP